MPAASAKRGAPGNDLFARRGGGGIQKRRARVDRDGDLDMDGPSRNGGKGRGRGQGGDTRQPAPTGRGKVNTAALQSQILRHVASGDNTFKPQRSAQPRSTSTDPPSFSLHANMDLGLILTKI
jgi:hypothetical protein